MNQPDNQPEELMTPEQVAAYYGVDGNTVRRWANTGRLPVARRTLGGHRRFRKADVIAIGWFEDRTRPDV